MCVQECCCVLHMSKGIKLRRLLIPFTRTNPEQAFSQLYLDDDVRRNAVVQKFIKTRSNFKQPKEQTQTTLIIVWVW